MRFLCSVLILAAGANAQSGHVLGRVTLPAGDATVRATATDPAGNIYLVASVIPAEFPLYSIGPGGQTDVFVAKFTPDLQTLVFAIRIGGTRFESPEAIAVDAEGNIAVAGFTESDNFPTTSGAFRETTPIVQTSFVVKLRRDGNMMYSTFMPASIGAVALDAKGRAWVAGAATAEDFSTTPDAVQVRKLSTSDGCGGTRQGYRLACSDAVLGRLSADGSRLEYGTYLGGRQAVDPGAFIGGATAAKALALGPDGSIFMAGVTTALDFPVTPGTIPIQVGNHKGFVAKFDQESGALRYATLAGTEAGDSIIRVQVDAGGRAYVAGARTLGYSSFAGPTVGVVAPESWVGAVAPSGEAMVFLQEIGRADRVAFDNSGAALFTRAAEQATYRFESRNVTLSVLDASGRASAKPFSVTGTGLLPLAGPDGTIYLVGTSDNEIVVTRTSF